MTHYEHEVEIEAPIEYVFQWGNDPENWIRSTPALLDAEVLEETDEGTRYRNTMKLLGRKTVSENITVVDEVNWRTVSTFVDGDMKGEMVWDHEETETGTLVSMAADIETGRSLFDRAIQPLVSRYMNRQFRNSLQTTKELVEAEYVADEPEVAMA